MTVTPATFAQQVATAKARNIAPVFTSETGKPGKVYTEVLWDDYCFICSRATDHAYEEHTDRDGNVIPQVDTVWTDEWTVGNIRYVEHNTRVDRA